MSKKIFIGCATKYGSTVEVAQTIADTITQNGIEADLLPIDQAADLSGYDGVILGSAIRMGAWLTEARDFISRHQDVLGQIPTAIFSVHILNLGDDPECHKARLAYTAPIKKIITPTTEAFFPGKIDLSQLNFFESLLFKVVNSPAGDFRDWDVVRSWAGEMEVALSFVSGAV